MARLLDTCPKVMFSSAARDTKGRRTPVVFLVVGAGAAQMVPERALSSCSTQFSLGCHTLTGQVD